VLTATTSRLSRNAAWSFSGQIARVGLQGAYFVIVARVLGVDGFGAFAGVVALVALASPYASLGALNLLVKHVSTGSNSAVVQFSNGVLVTFVVGAAFIVLLVLAAPGVAPAGVLAGTIAMIGTADIIAGNLILIAGSLGQARERLMSTALYPTLLNAGRLLGLIVVVALVPDADLTAVAASYVVSSVFLSSAVVGTIFYRLGGFRGDAATFAAQWKEGLLFAVSMSAQNIYNDIDKTMLARLDTLGAAGIYAAAYRILDFTFVPMRAALAAVYPRFFKSGANGLRSALAVSKTIVLPGIAYAVVVAAALLLGSTAIPVVLGAEYSQSVGAVQMLAALPLLRWIHYLAADSLTGAGYQGARTACQIGVAVINIGLNFWLITDYSWTGAVLSTLISDSLLGIILWGVITSIICSKQTLGRDTRSGTFTGHRGGPATRG
jgi:O-antigen/teichoic acid export membrane protein